MTLAERFLADQEPYLADDDGSLPAWWSAIAGPLEDLDALAQATDTDPGFGTLLDADTVPYDYLRWFGQAVGVSIPRGSPEASARASVQTPAGLRRGTLDAIKAAVLPTLVPVNPLVPATVIILERTAGGWDAADNPYHLTVATFTDETPSPSTTQAAALSQKPIGNIMDVVQISHWVMLTILANYASFDAVKAAFPTFNALKAGP